MVRQISVYVDDWHYDELQNSKNKSETVREALDQYFKNQKEENEMLSNMNLQGKIDWLNGNFASKSDRKGGRKWYVEDSTERADLADALVVAKLDDETTPAGLHMHWQNLVQVKDNIIECELDDIKNIDPDYEGQQFFHQGQKVKIVNPDHEYAGETGRYLGYIETNVPAPDKYYIELQG